MTFIKICGVTNVRDAIMVSKYADYVGVVVMARVRTPRLVNSNTARDILSVLSGLKPVAVVEGFDFKEALDYVVKLGFPIIQYHGLIDAEKLRAAHDVGVKVAPVINYDGDEVLRVRELIEHEDVEYVLIDAPKTGYRLFEHGLKIPIDIVRRFSEIRKVGFAGGINPENVRLVLRYKPYLIDVSSSVEESPGVKNEILVRRLYEVVRNGG